MCHSEISEEQRMKAACKRRARQVAIKDSTASLGPPDKKQHFDSSQVKKIMQTKSKLVNKGGKIEIDNEGRHEFEVRYQDGVWYKGWLSTFNCSTGKWIVKFYDDDETTEVDFPDKDVRLVKT